MARSLTRMPLVGGQIFTVPPWSRRSIFMTLMRKTWMCWWISAMGYWLLLVWRRKTVSQIYGRKDPQIRTKSTQTSASTCLMIKFECFLNAASMCWCDKKHWFDNKGNTQCAIFLPALEQYNGHHDWKLLETLPLINEHTKLPANKRLLVQTLDSNVGNVCCGFSSHWRHYMILNEQHNPLVRYQYSEVCGHDLQRCTQEEIDIETTTLGKLKYCSWQRGIGGIADTKGATTSVSLFL